jgi:hypothetical protein
MNEVDPLLYVYVAFGVFALILGLIYDPDSPDKKKRLELCDRTCFYEDEARFIRTSDPAWLDYAFGPACSIHDTDTPPQIT